MSNFNIKSQFSFTSSSAYITYIVLIISCVYKCIVYIEVRPAEKKSTEYEHKLELVKIENLELRDELDKVESSYDRLLQKENMPILKTPIAGENIIDKQVKFTWDYYNNNPLQEYYLEIRNMSLPGSKIRKYNVINPKGKSMYFPITPPVSYPGEYLWCIKPGNDDSTIGSFHGFVNYSSFSIYPSVIERIKHQKKILVGVSPTLYSGYFNYFDLDGNIKGFDIDLVNWIADELHYRLDISFEFSLIEFKHPYNVKDLCNVIIGNDLSFKNVKDRISVEFLNQVLKEPSLYKKVKHYVINKDTPAHLTNLSTMKVLIDILKEDFDKNYVDLDKYRQYKIKRLNRLLLEHIFPGKTPKSSSIETELIVIPWDDLFHKLKTNKIDMAVSSITNANEREEKHGIFFSDGYYENHQIFIMQEENNCKLPECLKFSTVGVKKNSTNQIVANYLSKIYKFNVDSSYETYDDLYEALNKNSDLKFCLVDYILVDEKLKSEEFYQFASALNETPFSKKLSEFYKKTFKGGKEEYAVAVTDTKLLDKINNILKKGKDKLKKFHEANLPVQESIDKGAGLKY